MCLPIVGLAFERGVGLSGSRRGVAHERDVSASFESGVLAAVPTNDRRTQMMEVMIGVDPHKGSHTATMLDRAAA